MVVVVVSGVGGLGIKGVLLGFSRSTVGLYIIQHKVLFLDMYLVDLESIILQMYLRETRPSFVTENVIRVSSWFV